MPSRPYRLAFAVGLAVHSLAVTVLADPIDPTGAPAPASLETDADAENPFATLSLDELMNVTVTSVTGVAQDAFQTPAAMYVITPDQLKRTGHLFLPEALRLVPGMSVGQLAPGYWAVSSRGFSDRFANKLQVLVDGRSIYDPFFTGTTWENQDILLAPDDLERIEIIRGPGATLWGSNAVNGVINVTSKPARETQGLLVTAGAGNPVSAFGHVRYGDQLGDDTFYRVWAKYADVDNFETPAGESTFDDWQMPRGGFRIDKEPDADTRLTLDGEAHNSDDIGLSRRYLDPTVPFDATVRSRDVHSTGGHLLGRAARETDSGGWSLQAYADVVDYEYLTGFELNRQTADIDWRQHFWIGDRNELVWGLGYRYHHIETGSDRTIALVDDNLDLHTVTLFAQDTFTVAPDRLFFMAGSKFEHNQVTGCEVQPNARLWWTPSERHTLWGSVSRAVRVPAPTETEISILAAVLDQGVLGGGPPNGVPVPILVTGDRHLDSEQLIAYEAGYRVKLTDDLLVDTAAFVNEYDDLINLDPALRFQNTGGATTYGIEVATTWRIADNWSVGGSYSFIEIQDAPQTPKHHVHIRSTYELTPDIGLHAAAYFVDEYEAQALDKYTRLDLGLTWRLRDNVEFALWGQNLLDPSHPEATETFLSAYQTEVPRSIYGQVTIRF